MTDAGKRLFLACWPDERLRSELHQQSRRLHKQTGGRRTDRNNLHMTLLFLGNTAPEQEQSLRRYCRALEADAFSMDIDRVGVWKRPRIAWAAPSNVPAALTELAGRLQKIAELLGHAPEKRAWRPHVTLLRKASGQVSQHEITPMHWDVDRFVLVESKTRSEGVQYRVIEQYDLNHRRGAVSSRYPV
jgi:2'-5' RNA ligase